MAAGSLLTLLDDIATLLDDVSVMTKVAAKKTAGVLGDDLALNAQQVTGVRAERELPVVWAVFKGSALNKLVMVPVALFLSAVFPWIITPLLMLGGAFLCYEGFEKVAHRLCDLVAQHQVAEHVLATQIQIAVLEADILVGLLVMVERRRLGLVQGLEIKRQDLDLAGPHVRVDKALGTRPHAALYLEHVLGANALGFGKNLRAIGIKNDLQ